MTSAAEIKRLAKLKRKKYREVECAFLANGKGLVQESLWALTRLFTDPDTVNKLSALSAPTGPVALSRGTADLYNPKTVRATMGSLFHALVAPDLEPTESLRETHTAGFVSAVARMRWWIWDSSCAPSTERGPGIFSRPLIFGVSVGKR